ncbi:hypothetical protein Patl1_12432 [Pistacia atlantica]|uniref:Uncharacterized protein n=1 Tax=Pistacia atlantica TaxID=434234 RepID=A0ACC1AXG5_9ROSI|nr:hypothetical protein Patl1_12432 [Pistacia atlantica]
MFKLFICVDLLDWRKNIYLKMIFFFFLVTSEVMMCTLMFDKIL